MEIKELLKIFHLKNETGDLSKIIFAIHTYYALFIKLLGAETLTYFRHRDKSFLSSLDLNEIKLQVASLENGDLFRFEGINNFNEGDFFSWYLLCWNKEIKNILTRLVNKLKNYDFSSLNLEPKEAKDLIKNIYHYLMPKNLRHNLGEYYTPGWLAEFVIDKMNINFSSNVRILDPTCGSGTFLTILIDKIKNDGNTAKGKILQKVLDSVVGIDLNPLAVISAKTNYLIALSDYLKDIKEGGIEIPIYLSDSLLAPLEFKEKHKTYYTLPTKVGKFKIPASLIIKKQLNTFLNLVIECIDIGLELEKFKEKFKQFPLKIIKSEEMLIFEIYETLLDLQKRGLNGIWAKIIKNIFAPSFFKNFDFIVGNPPWINWQNLPEEYRDSIKKYWEDYKVFLHKGLKARLGSAHDDISVLLTYVVIDKYLKINGNIGFVLPQNLLQASGGGDGFRRFQIKDNGHVKVTRVDDFVNVQPFADIGASNKPITIIMKKGHKTSYPIIYIKWNKKEKGVVPSDQPLNAVLPLLRRDKLIAEPIKKEKSNSSWLIAKSGKIEILKSLVGHSTYKARKGVDFSLNGLYWGKIKPSKIKDTAIFQNQADIGRKKLKSYNAPIEKEFIYPILRGRDISRWQTSPEYLAIIPYSTKGKCLSKIDLQENYPHTYKFFYKNDDEIIIWLKTRGIYQKFLKNANIPLHGLYDIGKYTFSKYKVVWKALASGMVASVISLAKNEILGNKLIIPDHNVLMVPFLNEDEAYYFCGILNSQIVNDFVVAYISWFYSSHILEHINIPSFNKNNKDHIKIVEISKGAHKRGKLKEKKQEKLNTLTRSVLSKDDSS